MDQRKTVIISTRDIHWRSSAYVHHKRDTSDEEETALRTVSAHSNVILALLPYTWNI